MMGLFSSQLVWNTHKYTVTQLASVKYWTYILDDVTYCWCKSGHTRWLVFCIYSCTPIPDQLICHWMWWHKVNKLYYLYKLYCFYFMKMLSLLIFKTYFINQAKKHVHLEKYNIFSLFVSQHQLNQTESQDTPRYHKRLQWNIIATFSGFKRQKRKILCHVYLNILLFMQCFIST